jgi:SAM-dependent methyltransferase
VEDSALSLELGQWLQTPPGQYVQAWEQRQADAMVANIFGYHAVQVGLPHWDLLHANRIPCKTRTCAAYGSPPEADTGVVADPENLPFESQSIDLLVLPHVLDCSANSHQILREAERVLVPEGHLLVSGFNPWSLWGVSDRIPGLDPILPIPTDYQVSLARLKDWFKLLSFEMDRGRFGCYVPPCTTDAWLRRWAFMESAGDRWWAVCGAVYMVTAVKRVAGMRLVEPAWKKQKSRRAARRAVVAGRHAASQCADPSSITKTIRET